MVYSIVQLVMPWTYPKPVDVKVLQAVLCTPIPTAAVCKVFTKQDWSVAKTKMFDRPAAQYVQVPSVWKVSLFFKCFK